MNKTIKRIGMGVLLATTASGVYSRDCNTEDLEDLEEAVGISKPTENKVDTSVAYDSLLDIIAYAEGTDDNYNIMFGGDSFDDLRKHPVESGEMTRRSKRFRGGRSTAAGKYQFKYPTFKWLKRKGCMSDLYPKSQDAGALCLIEWKKVTDKLLIAAIDNKDLTPIYDMLASTWASLPYSGTNCPKKGCGNGSSYWGQGGKNAKDLNQKFFEFYSQNKIES